jgi:hypothetical protein
MIGGYQASGSPPRLSEMSAGADLEPEWIKKRLPPRLRAALDDCHMHGSRRRL